MVTKSLMVVPPGMRIKTAIVDGESTSVFVTKTHRKGFKTPKKTRDRIRARMKEIRIPVLTLAANTVPIIQTAAAIPNLLKNPQEEWRQRAVVNSILPAYTGIIMTPGWVPVFNMGQMGKALLPNLVVWGINKLGIFKSVNQKLARTRLPVRLN